MKQIKLIILLATLFNIVGQKASAYDCKIDGIYYDLDDDNNLAYVTSSGYSNSYSGTITIPATISYESKVYNVSGVRYNTFKGCNITKVILNNNSIAKRDYTYSYSLANVFTPSVQEYVLGDEVKSIGSYAFWGCESLKSITISKNLNRIGSSAFVDCNSLNKVIVQDLTAWFNIDFESNPLSTAKHLYTSQGSEITELIVPNTVKVIKKNAFRNWKGLKNVTVQNGVESIELSAFEDCENLTKIVIPSSITRIGQSAFANCSSLEKVEIADISAWCNIDFYNIDSNPLAYAKHLYIGSYYELTELVLPQSIKTIPQYTFWGCENLKSVFFPSSIEQIDPTSFGNCNLKEVTINCDYLVSIETCKYFGENVSLYKIGNNVTTIGNSAFANNKMLNSITIPNSVKEIGTKSFSNCTGLISISIPSSVTSIGNEAFSGCSGLTSIEIPNNVASIASSTFRDCTGLTSVTIPNGVTIIGQSAFEGCSSLSRINIPSSLKDIEIWAFEGCKGLTSVHITDLSAWCNIHFYQATWGGNSSSNPLFFAHHLFLNGEEIRDLVIPNSVDEINSYAFAGCTSIKSITIPNSVKSIGPNAFQGNGIESVVFPNGLETIGSFAFSGCLNLKSIVIPNTVSNIGANAFSDCLSLYSVTSLLNLPFNLDETAFQYTGTQYDKDIVYMAATLYVPRGRVPMYSGIQGWQKFLNIMETDTKFKLTYIVDGEEYKTYEIQATEVITPEPDPYKEGCIFSGWSDIPYLMPAHDVTVTGTFTIDTAIDQIMSNGKDDAMIYTIDGKRLSKPQRGLNIVRMSDGTTRKVVVK